MPQRILIVDDERANLDVLEGLLLPLGHVVIRANDGREALRAFDRSPPDIVLLDLRMPGFDGIDVLTHLRATEAHAHVPVILVTAYSERDHRIRGLAAGADDFLEKPIDGQILLLRVRTLLALKESRDALARSRDLVATRNAELERLHQEQRELMQFIVHDLKTPLAVVLTNLLWVLDLEAPISRDIRDALDDATEGARRLRTMIEDLLTVSRLEESQFPLAEETLSVSEVLRGVLADYTKRARDKNVSLAPLADVDVSVRADRRLLQRVLENILDNSLRYTPRAGHMQVVASADGDVEIAVSNSGPAIPPSERLRIFDKFARGTSEVPVAGNAGLGLYFCKRAIEAQGGHIDVTESLEWPTSFVIHLPRAS